MDGCVVFIQHIANNIIGVMTFIKQGIIQTITLSKRVIVLLFGKNILTKIRATISVIFSLNHFYLVIHMEKGQK